MPHFSGIGHYTLELLKAMDRNLADHPNLSVKVFVHFRHVNKVRAFGFKHIQILHSPFSLRIANGLKIRSKQPPLDTLFGKGLYVFPNYSSWPLLVSKSIPFIYDLSYEKYPEFAEPLNQAFLSEQVKRSAKRAVHIATISENSKREIEKYYRVPPDKIGVYYPAVDTTMFYARSRQEITSTKKKYGISGNYILFVGNIEPRKNLKNLLLAYEKLDKKIKDKYSLLLIGAKGWQDGEIFEIIARLQRNGGKIQRPTGYVDDSDRPALYSGASLFVYPSIYEGFGIPPIEAMACGVPVIASNNSSLPEAVGGAAIQVSALDVSDIISSIQKVMGSDEIQRELIKKGYDQVKKFSWDTTAKNFIEAIERT